MHGAHANELMSNDRDEALCAEVVQLINDGSIDRRLIEGSVNDPPTPKRFGQATQADKDLWQSANPPWRFESTQFQLNETYHFIDRGQERTIGMLSGHGSCADCSLVDIGNRVRLEPMEDPGEHLRWAGWGNCDHLLFVKGEPIVVNGRFFLGESSATLISWLAADGEKRPLCALNRSDKFRLVSTLNLSAAVCQAATSTKTRFLAWQTSVETLGPR